MSVASATGMAKRVSRSKIRAIALPGLKWGTWAKDRFKLCDSEIFKWLELRTSPAAVMIMVKNLEID